ncbi:MAG TPA: NAD(P)-dependent oxidoreductase [Sulfitobacter sp.]|uniref:NAD-dependent epimerase/dehydratase family protein n=1 Tax=Sulfitobacter dubius TaxID=218673 RepID=UPI000C4E732E|nr:epimerase [Sulfitobacter sp.]HBB85599.1 NAD(P)-dependent oxidoreductase [Sulfitobacter sp.]
MTKFNKILITGAAGGIGTILRSALHPHCELLRSSDIVDVEPATANEQSFSFDLRDRAATMKAMEGIDIVYHFGGIPAEDTWETIRDVNIEGTYNIYEAARLNGVKRVVFASSNHAMGFHRRETIVGQDEPTRPDSRYGVSKVFGEAVGNLYADKHGLETISLRIGQFRPKPTNRRMLSLWLSPADMGRLAVSCLTDQKLHFEVVYGVSANKRSWYDNSGGEKIGYQPQDAAEDYAKDLGQVDLQEGEVEAAFQGGPFCSDEFDGDINDIR